MRYVLPLLLLAGCSSMTAEQCSTTNWYERGEQDAIMGNRPMLERYAQHCPGVTPSEKDYMQGWAIGYSIYNQRTSGSRM